MRRIAAGVVVVVGVEVEVTTGRNDVIGENITISIDIENESRLQIESGVVIAIEISRRDIDLIDIGYDSINTSCLTTYSNFKFKIN